MLTLMPRSSDNLFVESGQVAVLPLRTVGQIGPIGDTVRGDRSRSSAVQRFNGALKEGVDALHK